ncbi:MAG: hypothetical protein JSS81_09165 [Acidobacteria bacterium]|nr:hypothetical protein [Acidobacteriota bacterium]
MKLTRRDFVKISGISALAGFGLSGRAFAGIGEDSLAVQSSKSFRRLIGTDFYIWRENFATSARLVKLQEFSKSAPNGECFALIFEVPVKQIEQATYYVSHPEIGNFELFLTEGLNGRRRALIATFNRI